MKLSRQFYVSPCHESGLEVEQATEENRPGAVNSNVTHSRSHDLEALGKCFAPISAFMQCRPHPNFQCDQNSEQLRTDWTNRPAGHDLGWKCRESCTRVVFMPRTPQSNPYVHIFIWTLVSTTKLYSPE